MTNCKNCGAPLNDGKCGYCGSEYGSSGITLRMDYSKLNSLTDVMTPNEIRTLCGFHVEYGHGKFEKEK